MKIGFIGLGKMGARMAERLLEKKHSVVIWARHTDSMRPLAHKGAIATKTIEEFSAKLGKNKRIILMVTHGKPVDDVIQSLKPFISKGDIIVDGGNSFYRDSMRRASQLKKKGISFLDAGVSGGLEGA
ncbi:MAG: NAD(P)-binding domain-containing protein, partial [archaeon]